MFIDIYFFFSYLVTLFYFWYYLDSKVKIFLSSKNKKYRKYFNIENHKKITKK